MSKQTKKNKVLIVDDHPLYRKGIAGLLEQEPDLTVCGEASNDNEALAAINSLNPDAVILDISLGNVDGLDVLGAIKQEHPNLPVLILSMHEEIVYAPKAFRLGARGYVMKGMPPQMVAKALRAILRGEKYMSDRVRDRIVDAFIEADGEDARSIVESLTNRERQVFTLIGEGSSTRGISEKLCVSVKTVETHRAHIKEKLRIDHTTRLDMAARDWVARDGNK